MLKQAEPYLMTEDQKEKMDMANWIWNSHFWVEEPRGYFQCKWCSRNHTSTMPISADDHLCIENPKVNELLQIIAKQLEGKFGEAV